MIRNWLSHTIILRPFGQRALTIVAFMAIAAVGYGIGRLNEFERSQKIGDSLPRVSLPLLKTQQFRFSVPVVVMAHRGLSCYATENTTPAILLASQVGANGVEVDIHLTRDLVPVLYHDGNMRRLTGRNLEIEELNWDELDKIKIHPANRVLTLEDFLRNYAAQFDEIMLDMKHFNHSKARLDDVQIVASLVRNSGLTAKVIIDTSNMEFANAIVRSGLRCSVRFPRLAPEELKQRGIRDVLLRPNDDMERYVNCGIDVRVATVNDPEVALSLYDRGVRAVITDLPVETLDLLRGRGLIHAAPPESAEVSESASPTSPRATILR